MDPTLCRHFPTCGACVCPLDAHWPSAVHRPGEPVCRYLLGSGKQGAGAWYAGDPVFAAAVEQLPGILAEHPDIARKVALASRGSFRGQNLREATGKGPFHSAGTGVAV
jgi:hypothetical protein